MLRHDPASAIKDYYRYCDREIGGILSLIPKETIVMVVSDHGARKMDGGICFNEWLIKQGYLTLREYPSHTTPFSDVEIDWGKTLALGEGGYYGRLFLNVKGREPQGIVDPKDYEKVRSELIDKIEAIEDPEEKISELRPYDLRIYMKR